MTLSPETEMSISKNAILNKRHDGKNLSTTLKIFIWNSEAVDKEGRSVNAGDIATIAGMLAADLAECEPPVFVDSDDIVIGETHKFYDALVASVVYEAPGEVVLPPGSDYQVTTHVYPASFPRTR